jgi:hypothetical protein
VSWPRAGYLATLAFLLLSVLVVGCRRTDSTSRSSLAASGTNDASRDGTPCGELDCLEYDSAATAFVDTLAGGPLIVAVGEVHAPKGATAPSAAKRFTETLLPLLAGRASDLLVELMKPPAGCLDASAEVRSQQHIVTSQQAETDQSEYVAMGERARALGIVPDMLRPTCADIEAMRGKDGDAIGAALETIARLTEAQAKSLVLRDARSDADRGKSVVIYGGALHNDLTPGPEAARWSYAPELDSFVHGRFVAIDLVVPEFVGSDAIWRAQPWWSAYDPERLGEKTTRFRTGDRSFVLVFARSAAPRP